MMLLLAVALVAGCAGVASQTTRQTVPPQTFNVSGTISPAAGGNGATVTLGGAASATTTANSSGAFTFAGMANGTYTLTPSHAGYTFSPTSQNVTVSGANVTAPTFTATQQSNPTFSISGTITPAASGNGATVTLGGAASATTTANSSGAFTFTGLANGIYTLTPGRTGFTFNPTSENATVNGANVTAPNFVATQQSNPTFSISGTITPAASGNGAAVTLSGAASAATTANSSGAFTFTGLANGTYTLTPSRTGFTFNPTSENATVNGANVTAPNFTATATGVQPPSVPQGLTATAASSSQINLSWSASTDTSGTLAGYKVFRNGSQVNTTAATSSQDTGLAASTTYSYTVAAYDTAGNTSAQSAGASATTQGGGGGGGGGGTGGAWIPGFGKQGWFQYSGKTNLTAVCPPNNFNGTNYAWANSCVNVINAWGGGAYDQVGHRMVIFGGGHNDYPGNEIYTLNLGTSASDPLAGTMNRLTDPTTANQPDGGSPANQGGSQPYAWLQDSRGNGMWPNSTHSYNNLTVDGSGNFYFGGGAVSNLNGGTGQGFGRFNLSSLAWTRLDIGGSTPGGGSVPGDCGACLGTYEDEPMVYNPNNGHIIFGTGSFSTSHVYDYDPVANTSHLVMNSTGQCCSYNGMVYDSVDNKFYEFGGGDWKFTTPAASGTWPNWAAVGGCDSNCSAAISSQPVGAAYDSLNDVIYFFPGSGSTVYKYAPKTNTWAAIVTNTNPCTADSGSNGIFGRWQFDSTYQVGVYVSSANQQACVWWPAAASGTPTPNPPQISSLSPTSGQAGGAVTITGTNFGTSQGTSTVTFNGTAATVTNWSATSIGTTVPNGATTGNVVVTVGNQASNGVSFTVSSATAVPSITSLSPNTGPIGTAVTITGTNFGSSQGTSTVTISGTAATVTSWSATSIGTVVPNGVATGNVVVTVGSQPSNGANFTVSSSGGAINGWSSRIAGVNVPGGAASIVSSQSFDTFPAINIQQYFQFYEQSQITTDCTVAADGCSLKFTMLPGNFQGEPGWFNYNFNSTNTALYGPGQEFYVQFKERLDPGFLAAGEFGGGNFTGFKMNIISEGDSPTQQAGNCSNTPTDFVLISSLNQQSPNMYENCGSVGINLNFLNSSYDLIQLYGPTLPGGGNYLDQPASGCPHYSGRGVPNSDPSCWNFVANEWFTVQEHFKIGTWGATNSSVDVWMAHQGQPSRLIVNAADIAMADQGPSITDKFGKIVLLPYATASTWVNTTFAWYDDLIVSDHRIPDPEVGVPNAPDGLTASVSGSNVTLNWRVNSNNGTAQDDTGILVERCAGTAPQCLAAPQSGFSQIVATAAHATTYTDATGSSGTTYTYRVRATNSSGNSAYAVAICFNNGTTCSTVTP